MSYQNTTLKDIRLNSLGFSQAEMAQRLNMSLSDYLSIEDGEIKLDLLMRLAQSVNMSIEELLSSQKEEVSFEIEDKWTTIDEIKEGLNAFLKTQESTIKKISDPYFSKQLDNLVKTVNTLARKPRIAVVGKSDVGKSTLINCLLGSKSLPEAWTPTTSIIIYARHISERPKYLKDNVIVFKSDSSNSVWEPSRSDDEKYTLSLQIAKGDYALLNEYGARKNGAVIYHEATAAVVYIDSPILRNCDILDLPGYGTGDRKEDDSLLRQVNGVDILIYMSLANGFFRGDDILWLQNELPNLNNLSKDTNELKPLDNIFIVASQAHTVANGSMEQLSLILDKGSERFESTLPKDYWKRMGMKVKHDYFRSRFYTYSTNQKDLRKDFDESLSSILEILPQLLAANISETVHSHIKNSIKEVENHVRSFRGILDARDKKKKIVAEIEKGRTSGLRKIENLKSTLKKDIEQFQSKSCRQFTAEFNETVTVDYIKSIIKDRGYKNKEDDIRLLVATLSNEINARYQDCVKQFNSKYRPALNKFFELYDEATAFDKLNEGKGSRSFSSKKEYMRAMNQMAESEEELGANKGWAIEEVYQIGMPLSGLSTIMGFASLVGGISAWFYYIPIINNLAIAFGLVSLLITGLASINWDGRIANKIVEEYDNKNVLQECIKNLNEFGISTSHAFSKGILIVDKAANSYLTDIKKLISDNNEVELLGKIDAEEQKRTLFTNLKSLLN